MTLKSTLKRMPGLVRADRALHEGLKSLQRRRAARDVELLRTLALFGPYSSGDWSARAQLATQGAQQVFPFLLQLLLTVGAAGPRPAVSADAFCDTTAARAAAARLAELFLQHGSDKASAHNYHLIYGRALQHPDGVARILEVGLGTNNEDVVSHMGRGGRPGASLRAFRDFLPDAEIIGADVDRRVLFQEDRIRTYFCDQSDLASFAELAQAAPGEFDLVIDDGLHTPSANLAVMIHGLPRLRPGGWLIVEDIAPAARPFWDLVQHLMPRPAWDCQLIDARGGLVFAVRRA